MIMLENRGAGHFLPGVWGCPPLFSNPPKIEGSRGLTKTFSIGDLNGRFETWGYTSFQRY